MTEEKICECGIIVKGTSEKHLESNMEQHFESKLHKVLIQTKQMREEE